jgi:hypothetical protein
MGEAAGTCSAPAFAAAIDLIQVKSLPRPMA